MRKTVTAVALFVCETIVSAQCCGQTPDLSGIWLNRGRPDEVCTVRQFGDKVFFLDEDDHGGVGRIVGSKLKVGKYRFANLEATISDDGKRLSWRAHGGPAETGFWTFHSQDNKTALFLETFGDNDNQDSFPKGDEDEVVVIVAGVRSDGHVYRKRIPTSGHWDMEDDEDSRLHKRWNVPLWEDELRNGEWADVVVAVIEVDDEFPLSLIGGVIGVLADNYKNIWDMARAMAKEEGLELPKELPPHKIIAAVEDAFSKSGDNDPLGAVRCQIKREANGQLSVRWSGVSDHQNTDKMGNLFGPDNSVGLIRLMGDDWNYALWLSPWNGTYPK